MPTEERDDAGAEPEATDVKPQGTPSDPDDTDAGEESSAAAPDSGSDDSDDGGDAAPAPKLSRRDKRIQRLLARTAEQEALIAKLSAAERAREPASTPDDPQPKREDFEDYEDFVRADARWVARSEVRELQSKTEARQRAARAEAEEAQTRARWESSHEAAIDKYDDYEPIYDAVGTSINAEQAAALRAADAPAEVVYHLGKNPKELAKFKGLTGAALIKAVGRYEERIANLSAQRSRAPAPVNPVKGKSGGTGNRLSDDLPIEKWMEIRNRQAGRS